MSAIPTIFWDFTPVGQANVDGYEGWVHFFILSHHDHDDVHTHPTTSLQLTTQSVRKKRIISWLQPPFLQVMGHTPFYRISTNTPRPQPPRLFLR